MEKQVRRMLADPKASSLVTSFAMKWLNLTTLDQVVPDPMLFPGIQRATAARFFDRSGSLHRQHLLGGPKRCGSPDRRLHVPE